MLALAPLSGATAIRSVVAWDASAQPLRVHVSTGECACACVYMHVCVCVCACVGVRVRICICECVSMRVGLHMDVTCTLFIYLNHLRGLQLFSLSEHQPASLPTMKLQQGNAPAAAFLWLEMNRADPAIVFRRGAADAASFSTESSSH